MNSKRGFASDNNSGIHPRILKAVERANTGHWMAYGDDPFTASAIKVFEKHFGNDLDVYFVFTGTGANVLGLRAVTASFESIMCTEIAHLNVDECGAPENITGCKLKTVPTKDGKMCTRDVEPFLAEFGNEHHTQPRVVSITQATELGTVYRPDEIKKIAIFAHENGLLLHMDGARISNAAAFLNMRFREFTRDAGVDILSFGGTKNGMMIGEAVIFFNKNLSQKFKYIRKQGMQLASKMRFISVQFEEFLSGDLWLQNARHANKMARILAREIKNIPECKITQKVESNSVFVIIPRQYLDKILKKYFFYIWNENGPVVRLMTSFDTREEDIDNFIDTVKKAVKN